MAPLFEGDTASQNRLTAVLLRPSMARPHILYPLLQLQHFVGGVFPQGCGKPWA